MERYFLAHLYLRCALLAGSAPLTTCGACSCQAHLIIQVPHEKLEIDLVDELCFISCATLPKGFEGHLCLGLNVNSPTLVGLKHLSLMWATFSTYDSVFNLGSIVKARRGSKAQRKCRFEPRMMEHQTWIQHQGQTRVIV